MNISSLTNSWSKYISSNNQTSNSANAFDFNVQAQSNDESKPNRLDNSSAQAFFSGMMNQGLLPISSSVNSSSDSSTVSAATSTTDTSSNSSLSLADFLDKVKNGTVTDSDLSTLQSELNSLTEQSGSFMMPPPPPMPGSNMNSSDNLSGNQQLMASVAQAYENNSVVSNVSQNI